MGETGKIIVRLYDDTEEKVSRRRIKDVLNFWRIRVCNMKKRIFNVIVFFIINYFIFNCIFSLTEMIILKICEYNTSFSNLFIESIKNNLLFFTIIYVIIFYYYVLEDKKYNKKLNEQLINHIRSIENDVERKNQIDYSLSQKFDKSNRSG